MENDGSEESNMLKNSKWIRADFAKDYTVSPLFRKTFCAEKVKKATLEITAKGIYYAEINGKRVGNFVLAPGFTKYSVRHQYQTYDVTALLTDGENVLDVTVSAFWYHGRIVTLHDEMARSTDWKAEIIALLTIETTDGGVKCYSTDESWLCGKGKICFADIYDGEVYDSTLDVRDMTAVSVDDEATAEMLIPQEGELVTEHEIFAVSEIIVTPKGETVIDFGQNISGYPELCVNAKEGERVSLSFAEILDKDGNFYNENYRSAKCRYEYVCSDGVNVYKPHLTFYGFRYMRIDEFPKSAELSAQSFKAISLYSDIKKTGSLVSGNEKINRLFSNVFWGQKCNFVDIPTDCPQRDERLGWTGDAQVFAKTATYNFDVERFYKKWLRDMAQEVNQSGRVSFIVPNLFTHSLMAAAWSDAGVIVPWQVYETYGDREFLAEMIDTMTATVEAMAEDSGDKYIWKKGANTHQFGDWLGTDAPEGSYTGISDKDLIQAGYYVYDIGILVRAYRELGLDCTEYEERYVAARERFMREFPEYKTQTECALVLYFGLTDEPSSVAKKLNGLVESNGYRLTTGFVGTPYLLYALSENGYTDTAYRLLLQEAYPSWLFSVNMGATTMWEHWDGINEDGKVWSRDMNSFNHYAYGAVASWVYEEAAGIRPASAGFKRLRIEPKPSERLGSLEASIETRRGIVSSKWYYLPDGKVRYEITVPSEAEIVIGEESVTVEKGTYVYVR